MIERKREQEGEKGDEKERERKIMYEKIERIKTEKKKV